MRKSIKWFRLITFLCLFVTSLQVSAQNNYFISAQSGSDQNDGKSISSAFKNIQKAASMVTAGDTVFIAAGIYREEITVNTSGSEGNPIVFQAYNNEKPVITTTDILTNWTQDKGNIYKASFNSGITKRINMTIFVDDVWIKEAHWSDKGNNVDILNESEHPNMDTYSSTYIQDDDLKAFPDDYWNGAFVAAQVNSWGIQTRRITDFDGTSGTIHFDGTMNFSGVANKGYQIFDSYNALDAAGEWYFDDNNNSLYVWGPQSKNINNCIVELKTRKQCFKINGQNYIQFKNLELKGGSIEMAGSNNTLIQGCHIRVPDWDFGPESNPLVVSCLELTGSNNLIRDNEVEGICVQFIKIEGEKNQVINNYIHDIGYKNVDGAAINLHHCGDSILISHNTFDRTGHSVISGAGGYHMVLQHNKFSNTCLLTVDVGAIGFGNSSYSNSIIHHNVFYNMAVMSAGVYMDALSADILIHHNISYNNAGWGLKINMPATNVLAFNNTLFNNGVIDGMSATENLSASGVRFFNNIYSSISERFLRGGSLLAGNYVTNSSANFEDVSKGDFRLSSGSGAIDCGIVINNVKEEFNGNAPDAGAIEYGEEMWEYGHNFENPPSPEYVWYSTDFSNFISNSSFEDGLNFWSKTNGNPTAIYANTWNYKDEAKGIRGTGALELKPNDKLEQKVDGLKPNSYYKVTAKARILGNDIQIESHNQTNGTYSGNHYGNEYSFYNFSEGQWFKFNNVDFGTDKPVFNQLEVAVSMESDMEVEIRLDNLSSAVIASGSFSSIISGSRWHVIRSEIPEITGKHTLYLIIKKATSISRIDRLRFLNTDCKESVQIGVTNFDESNTKLTKGIGYSHWTGEEGFIFKTGDNPSNTALILEKNDGLLNGYVETVSIVNTDTLQLPFNSHKIPGTIQMEDFDTGGQGIGHNYINFEVESNSYRTENIDLEIVQGSGDNYYVNNIKAGEWLEFTLNSVEAGTYEIELTYQKDNTEKAKAVVLLDNKELGTFSFTANIKSYWSGMTIKDVIIDSDANKKLKFRVTKGALSIDKIKLTKVSNATSSLNFKSEDDIIIYPNPVTESLNIDFKNYKPGTLSANIYDSNGALKKKGCS